MIVAGTGHRPDAIRSFGHAYNVAEIKLKSKPVDVFISGMAAGFDIIAAEAALANGIEVWAAIPWLGHKDSLPKDWQERWMRVYDAAKKRHVIVEQAKFPGNKCYFDRNHWMVDNADVVMAYWNPETKTGGTYECINYALDNNVPVANTWNDPPF